MTTFIHHFGIAAAAAFFLEVFKAYTLIHNLSSKRWQRLKRSPSFWCLLLGMICASGFFGWVFYAESPNATAAELAMSGASLRSLVRESFSALAATKPVTLGADTAEPSSLRMMFS
jgi:hypothetical protein